MSDQPKRGRPAQFVSLKRGEVKVAPEQKRIFDEHCQVVERNTNQCVRDLIDFGIAHGFFRGHVTL